MDLRLCGKTYKLKFGHLAIRTIEKHYGMGINQVFKDKDMESVETLSVFLYASMKKLNKAITIDEVDELIDDAIDNDEITYEELANAIKEVTENSKIVNGNKKK